MKKSIGFIIAIMISGCLLNIQKAESQILLGVNYSNEVSVSLGTPLSRSGANLMAAYFLGPHLSMDLELSYFGKALVDANYNTICNWNSMSEVFGINYHFLTSNVRPHIGINAGHYNDFLTDEALPNYFNENSLLIGSEIGILANMCERFKLNVSVEYNYIASQGQGTVVSRVGILVPLKAR